MKIFAIREKLLRIEHDYTMKQVAEGTGLTESAVSRYESGKREPNGRVISCFCKFYGVSADYLLGLVDEPQAKYGQVWNPASIPGPRKVQARAARLKDKPHKLGGAG
jgi:transcriptional regulator with XRE-family HTH domain